MNKKAIFLLVGVSFLGIALIALNQNLIVREYDMQSEKILTPVRLVVISDLHSTLYGEAQEPILEKIAAQAPDVILLAGDIVDDKLPEEPGYLFLEKVVEIAPTYYVMGNHEIWSGHADEIREKAIGFGVNVLRNEKVSVEINGEKIILFGIDDPHSWEYEDDLETKGWNRALSDLWESDESGLFQVLISHRPEQVATYEHLGFDLIVAGHAHGGQVRIPFLVNGLLTPNQGFFPDYAGGEYLLNDVTTMIVSRGTVVNWVPRVFNRPEVVVIDLQ